MLIAKYTSLKEIILNVYRDSGADRELNIDDLAYWTYEAMDKIGYPLMYVPKVYGKMEDPEWAFEDYRVKLPCDFHKLRALSVDGNIAIPASNSYHDLMDGSCCGWDSIAGSSTETYYDNFGNIFSPSAEPITNPTKQGFEPINFSMNNSYITFNVESGDACMAYWAFPVDVEGFPMIPDVIEVKSAVTHYLMERLDWRLFRKGIITGEVYKISSRERNFYMASATAALKMFDEHQMESFKNMWMKMIVRKDDYMSAFRQMNKPGKRGRY
jgi:hypothetical protein